jgi:hypothetical protein
MPGHRILLMLALSAAALAATAAFPARATPGRQAVTQAASSGASRSSPLIDKVRVATERYTDVNVALAEGWVQATPCVSGPDFGAMGVHFVLPSRLGDATLDAAQPEALIYEPAPSGALRLVGVEFIVMASAWASHNPGGAPPALEGNLLNYVAAPNRFGLPAFYELHVWAWEHNQSGSLADWNPAVSCDHQSGP